MKQLICIVCPNSCMLSVDENLNVCGQKCKRGEAFAKNEMTSPMRTVCTTVKSLVDGFAVVPVKTDGEIPKSKVLPVMKLLSKTVIDKPMDINQIVVYNALDTGVNVVVTCSMTKN